MTYCKVCKSEVTKSGKCDSCGWAGTFEVAKKKVAKPTIIKSVPKTTKKAK